MREFAAAASRRNAIVAGSQERARAHARSHYRDGTNRALRERATMAPSRNRNRHDHASVVTSRFALSIETAATTM